MCIYTITNLCEKKALFNYCLAYGNIGHLHAYTQDYFLPLNVQYKAGCELHVTSVKLCQYSQWVQMFMSNFSKTFIRKFSLRRGQYLANFTKHVYNRVTFCMVSGTSNRLVLLISKNVLKTLTRQFRIS